jgi:hypothetical protein
VNKTTLRILEVLTSEIGTGLSINNLTEKIHTRFGTGFYRDVYKNVQLLAKQGILEISKEGNSSIISINFTDSFLVDILAEMELERKRNFLQKRKEFQIWVTVLSRRIIDFSFINSISIIYPEKNAKLNRVEMLFLLSTSTDRNDEYSQREKLQGLIDSLQNEFNFSLDALFMSPQEFIKGFRSSSINPVKEMMSNKIVIFFPQKFWLEMQNAIEKEQPLKSEEREISPLKITEEDLVSNLAMLGYKEIGTDIRPPSKLIGIEYIITAILMGNDQRRIDAVPILIAKNQDLINYDLLVFLSKKYRTYDQLFSILTALNKIKPIPRFRRMVNSWPLSHPDTLKIDLDDLQRRLRLYNVIK